MNRHLKNKLSLNKETVRNLTVATHLKAGDTAGAPLSAKCLTPFSGNCLTPGVPDSLAAAPVPGDTLIVR